MKYILRGISIFFVNLLRFAPSLIRPFGSSKGLAHSYMNLQNPTIVTMNDFFDEHLYLDVILTGEGVENT